jgi:serine/threonine protein phosphatase 1
MPLTCAIGDIHGSLPKLRRLIAQCEKYAGGQPLIFIFLGDYIDRGPQSAGVVSFVMELQSRPGGSVIALKGNHEAMALAVIDDEIEATHWLAQGGLETLRSYQAASVQELPGAHVDWLRALPTSYDDGRRLFVHAGVDPQRPLNAQRDHDLYWIREPFLSDRRDYGRLIVHGHTPLNGRKPDQRANRLNLDTGAVFGGPLTAAVFTDDEVNPVVFLQVD